MLKRKRISALLAISMIVGMFSSFSVVQAAERQLAPWAMYYAPQNEHEDFTKFLAGEIATSAEGKTCLLSTSPEFYLTTNANGKNGLRVTTDALGHNGYGASVIGFTAPKSGTYKVDLWTQHTADAIVTGDLAFAMIGTVNAERTTVSPIDTLKLGSGGGEMSGSVTVELNAGTELTANFYTSADGWLRWWDMTYKITDMSSGKVYDFNDIGMVYPPETELTKTEWNLNDYRQSVASKDNSVWSYAWAGDIGVNGSWGTDDTLWNNPENWLMVDPATNKNTNGNGIFNLNGGSWFNTNEFANDGWFEWRSDWASDGRSTFVLGWTAPATGTYFFDFDLKNLGLGGGTSDQTQHAFAYKKKDETTLTKITRFGMPAAVMPGNPPVLGEMDLQLKVEEGETIYLFNDPNADGWQDNCIMRFEVTDANDPSKKWSPAGNYSAELTDSPYRVWFAPQGATNFNQYTPVSLITPDATETRFRTDESDWGKFFLSQDGTFLAQPQGSANAAAGSIAVTFDAPADGYYELDLDIINANGEVGAGDPENAYCNLYKLTDATTALGTAVATVGPVKRVQKNLSKKIELAKGDRLVLNIDTVTDGWLLALKGSLNIKLLDKFTFTYTQNGTEVNSVSDLTAGETLTATLDYIDQTSTNIQIVTAFYNADNTMVAVGVSNPTVSDANGITTLTASVTVPELTAGTTVKTFVLDGINTLKPLCLPDSL